MSTAPALHRGRKNLADLLAQLGDIPPSRIWVDPPPGTATEKDVLEIEVKENRLCELIDGTLVEKPIGFGESYLAAVLLRVLGEFVTTRDLGILSAPDGMMRIAKGLVRIPDVAFISWGKLPRRKVPAVPIPALSPDLAVEILSETNTPQEMKRKCREYFQAGTRLVWLVDPKRRQVRAFTSPQRSKVFRESQTLDGSPVLPGFRMPLRELFRDLEG